MYLFCLILIYRLIVQSHKTGNSVSREHYLPFFLPAIERSIYGQNFYVRKDWLDSTVTKPIIKAFLVSLFSDKSSTFSSCNNKIQRPICQIHTKEEISPGF